MGRARQGKRKRISFLGLGSSPPRVWSGVAIAGAKLDSNRPEVVRKVWRRWTRLPALDAENCNHNSKKLPCQTGPGSVPKTVLVLNKRS